MIRAEDLARTIHGRRSGRNLWRCQCPVHKGRSLDLGIGKSGKIVLKCWGGCRTEDVLAALGLTWKDILGERGKLSPEQRQQIRDEKRLEAMERRHGLVIMAQVVIPTEKRYWQAAERRLADDIEKLKDKMTPGRAEAKRSEDAKWNWFIVRICLGALLMRDRANQNLRELWHVSIRKSMDIEPSHDFGFGEPEDWEEDRELEAKGAIKPFHYDGRVIRVFEHTCDPPITAAIVGAAIARYLRL